MTQSDTPFAGLAAHLSVSKSALDKCIDVVQHTCVIRDVPVTTRMHYLKFDGNGQPVVGALAECLYNHVIEYCIASRNRPTPLSPQDAARLTKEARKLFRHPKATADDPDQTGEAGEMLLYLLIEAVLGAPQVVAKMELKTNSAVEVHGSDGIHMAWRQAESLVDVYFGESKLYQDVGAAMTNAIDSVEKFHLAEMYRHEFKMVTKYFKHAAPEVQLAVAELLRDGLPGPEVRLNHACLIGYDWVGYATLQRLTASDLTAAFRQRYLKDAGRLHDLLQKRFDPFGRKHLRFEFFLMPFEAVQKFRDAFNSALA